MFARWSDVIAGLFLVVASIVMYEAATSAGGSAMSDVDFTLAPRLVAICLGILSLFLLLVGGKKALSKSGSPKEDTKGSGSFKYPAKLAGTIALVLAAGIVFEPLGFVLTAVFYLLAQGYVLSYTKTEFRFIPMLIFAVVASLVINYVFGTWLSMPLPEGVLAGVLNV